MTEAEWLACNDPVRLMQWEQISATAGRFRLFAVACCRRIPVINSHPDLTAVIDTVERFADRLATEEEMRVAHIWSDSIATGAAKTADAHESAEGITGNTVREWQIQCAGLAAHLASMTGDGLWTGVDRLPGVAADAVALVLAGNDYDDDQVDKDAAKERAVQADLFRDIFGNPFRPVAFSPSWRTDTAVSLARQMYDARDFGTMPILADALQDAGCDSEDVLSHCREANATHVRGCWVVDGVLGKE